MKLTQILGLINIKLAGETLTYNQAQPYLDACVCDINTHLNACFPMFSTVHPTLTQDANYEAIPDTYIVSVIVPGVAFKFYTTDEEGISTAAGYQQEYERGLFYMVRDYSASVPEQYKAENRGYVEGPAPSFVGGTLCAKGLPTINPDLRYIEGRPGPPGPPGPPGYTPKKGIDYYTPDDIATLGLPQYIGMRTTLASYGITDAYTKLETDKELETLKEQYDNLVKAFENKADKHTTLAGYGIEDAYDKDKIDAKLEGRFANGEIIKAFVIKSVDKWDETKESGTVSLETVEGLQVGMLWNIFIEDTTNPDNTTMHCSKIRGSIVSIDTASKSVELSSVTKLVDEYIKENVKSDVLGKLIVQGGTVGHVIVNDLNKLFTTYSLGNNCIAGLDAIALNVGTKALGYGSFASGYYTQALGERAVAMNYKTIASGNESLATGCSTIASGVNSTAMGWNNEANGDNSFSIGVGSKADGEISFATGYHTKAKGSDSFTSGFETEANEMTAFAINYKTKANGSHSFAGGISTEANGAVSFAIGNMAKANGYGAFAGGQNAEANNRASFSFGSGCKATGMIGFATGAGTEAIGVNASTFGKATKASAYCAQARGKFNIDGTNFIDIVGIGTNENDRRNGYSLDLNGNAEFAGNVTFTHNGKKYNLGQVIDALVSLGKLS